MIRMMVIVGVCAGIFASAGGMAQSLYKCTDPQGRNSYQSVACDGHQQQAWARDMAVASSPAPAPPNAVDRVGAKTKAQTTATRTARGEGRRSSPPPGGGAAISLHADPAACERAKEKRRRTYEKLGLKRSFETSRRMDDLVYQACR
jgi:hypothetical protein